MNGFEGAGVVQIFFYNQLVFFVVNFEIAFWVERHLQKLNLLNALQQVPLHL